VRPTPLALGAFTAYLALALLVGEVFPFSRFDMYAGIADRQEAAVPMARVGERWVSVFDYSCFDGPIPARDFRAVPSSMNYRVFQDAAWVRDHQGQGGDVTLEVGWLWLRRTDSGITESFEPTGTLSACAL